MFSRSTPDDSNHPIIIEDHSILICLILNALLVAAGLLLAKTEVLGEAGRLFADSNQTEISIAKVETQPASKVGSVSATADIKPKAQPSATMPLPVKPAPAAAGDATPKPKVPTGKTTAAVMPKADPPPGIDSQPPPGAAKGAAAAAETVLTTMRGGRHPRFASIVFECNGPIDYDKPKIQGDEIIFKLKKMETRLRPYRKYKTFDSWARLEKTGADIDVDIGLLPGFIKFSAFLMEDPHRLVINLYDKDR